MQRREVISLLSGAAAAWPLAARSEQRSVPVIGYLSPGSPEPSSFLVTALREGLKEASYIEGKNISIEYRWARGHYDQLQTLAADLVQRQVAVIAATGGTISAQAAKEVTSTIPIIFNVGDDPIRSGLVASFNRPGGNITGVSTLSPALETKRLALLRELVRRTAIVAVLVNATNPDRGPQLRDINAAATQLGQELRFFYASSESEIATAFGGVVEHRADALLVANDVFLTNQRDQIVALAARHAIPTIYAFRQFAESGGLMSYSTNLIEVYRQIGVYVGRVLKGEKPADLPVVQPTKFELVINIKTAKALGLEIPDKLLALADEVID
ncbi:MAG: ABC transporter substrate-binding protein [Xanthobacteraceae bacterium]